MYSTIRQVYFDEFLIWSEIVTILIEGRKCKGTNFVWDESGEARTDIVITCHHAASFSNFSKVNKLNILFRYKIEDCDNLSEHKLVMPGRGRPRVNAKAFKRHNTRLRSAAAAKKQKEGRAARPLL